MRFETISAFLVGSGIPVLGTYADYCQRGYKISFGDLAGNLDDYLAGGLLLFAGWALVRRKTSAPIWLVVAWAYVTSLMVSSSWGQIQDTLQGHADPENTEIVIGKLVILATCIVSLALSFRRAARIVSPGAAETVR
jgi:hypothetical protein